MFKFITNLSLRRQLRLSQEHTAELAETIRMRNAQLAEKVRDNNHHQMLRKVDEHAIAMLTDTVHAREAVIKRLSRELDLKEADRLLLAKARDQAESKLASLELAYNALAHSYKPQPKCQCCTRKVYHVQCNCPQGC